MGLPIRFVALFAMFLLLAGGAAAGPTIDRLKSRGILVCGVGLMHPGFAYLEARGV